MFKLNARVAPVKKSIGGVTRLAKVTGLLCLYIMLHSHTASAEDHSVNAVGVKFDPVFLYVEPGDTVNWENMAGHNVETIDAMVPEGQEKINTELGANVTAVFEGEGIIVYKCTPHWGARMGGVIVVGKPEDPGATIDAYLETLKTDKSNLPAKGLLKKLRKDMEAKELL
jgi:pseudoazurin